MFKIWNICACSTSNYSLVHTIYRFLTWCSWKLTLRKRFDKLGLKMSFSWEYFLVCISLLEMSTSTQAVKLKLGRKKFVERSAWNLQVRIHFFKERITWPSWCNHRPTCLSKNMPIVNFNFLSRQEIRKWYVF